MALKKRKEPQTKRTQKKRRAARGGRTGRILYGVLVLLAVAATAFFLFMRFDSGTTAAENTAGTIFAPVQNAFSSVTKFFRDMTSGIRDYNTMQYQYEASKQEVQSLKMELSRLEEEALENIRLRSLLDMKEQYADYDPIAATVIARNAGVWMDTFSINRGSIDGIQANMTVITADGLVGRVIDVGLAYSKVRSIIDPNSAVGCQIERTRNKGSMRGVSATGGEVPECYVYYLPAVNDVVPGDTVLTSGDDRIYPKGIKIGTVTAVSRQSDLSDQYIVVVPYVDFQTIEEVLVLRVVVETDQEALPALPTPSPRPTPETTPTPTPTVNPNATPEIDEDAPWERPTQMPDAIIYGDATPEPSETPQAGSTLQPGEQMEDLWLNS